MEQRPYVTADGNRQGTNMISYESGIGVKGIKNIKNQSVKSKIEEAPFLIDY